MITANDYTIVYRGSPYKIRDSSKANYEMYMGEGIYMTERVDVALEYATKKGYIHQISFKEKDVIDLTVLNNCYKIIRLIAEKAEKETGVNIQKFIPKENIEESACGLHSGEIMFTRLDRELNLWLDCNENFYSQVKNTEEVLELIERIVSQALDNKIIKYKDNEGRGNFWFTRNNKLLTSYVLPVEQIDNIRTQAFFTVKAIWKKGNSRLVIESPKKYILDRRINDKEFKQLIIERHTDYWYINMRKTQNKVRTSDEYKLKTSLDAINKIKSLTKDW